MATAQDRGWGAGWPNCQPGTINTTFNSGGTRFPGGVRREISELVDRLVKETKKRGYRFGNANDPNYGCWGYMCRAIGGTNSPSNHSWGLAVDINAPTNPHKRPPMVTDMPSWMPALWKEYGFNWGGTYSSRPDAMHYEFMGSPQDAARLTQKARDAGIGDEAAPTPTPPPQPAPAVPAFPFPKGHWMGVESNDPKNHSGAYTQDQSGIKQYQQRMLARGWKNIGTADGLYGPKTRDCTISYQREKGLAADGLAGEQTWHSVWTAPIT